MRNRNVVRLIFPEVEQVPPDSPDASHLPSTHDADPGVSAEIAVERGEATPQQEAYVEALDADQPLLVGRGETIEVEHEAPPRSAASTFSDTGDEPMLANPDGTFTRLESTRPDPSEERNET
jgi:hypothetical protein